jgi:hypothetical protein
MTLPMMSTTNLRNNNPARVVAGDQHDPMTASLCSVHLIHSDSSCPFG